MKSYFVYSSVVAICLAGSVVAQETLEAQDILDLDLDSLLTDEGRWKLELSSRYTHVAEDNLSIGFVPISDGLGGSIDVPIDAGLGSITSDLIVASAGLRYGLTPETELLARASFTSSLSRSENVLTGAVEEVSSTDFTGLSFGLNHRFKDADETFGLISFANVDTATKQSDGGFNYGKSGVVGITLYQVYDPIVLSLTSGYRPRLERSVDNLSVDLGDTFYINPTVSFAVNNDITLTGGIAIDFTNPDYIGGERISTTTTQSQIDFSVARSLSETASIRFDANIGVVGSDTVSL